jgi:peptidoglycan/LPS O-acetylase OafA/YrhL
MIREAREVSSMSADGVMPRDKAVRVTEPPPLRVGARSAAQATGAAAITGETLPTEYVDGVRGVAATYVMLNHARFLLFISAATALALHPGTVFKAALAVLALTRYGVAGVMCFFIVSGYAIHYRQAFKMAGTWQKMSWRSYALHRARRLYPPLLAAIVIIFVADTIGSHFYPGMYNGASNVVLSLGGDHTPSVSSLLGTLTFTQGFLTKVFGSDDPLWSLAYEGFFYLMYPIVLGLDLRLGPVKTLGMITALGLSIAAIIGMGITPDGLHVDLFSPQGIAAHALNLLAMWPAWVAGVFIADARAGRVRIPTQWWSIAAVVGLLMLGASALYLVVKNPNIQINDINIFYLIWVVSFFGPIGWLCAGRHAIRARKVVAGIYRPIKWLGKMSYSLYVVHFPVLAMICAIYLSSHDNLPRTPWLMFGGIVAALSVGYGVYRIAEKPVTKRNLNRVEAQVKAESGLLPIVPATPTPNRDPAELLDEVTSVAQAWITERWRAPSQVSDVREVPPKEFGVIPAQLGAMPERAWMVRLHVGSTPQRAPSEAIAIVALHGGTVRAVEPPTR